VWTFLRAGARRVDGLSGTGRDHFIPVTLLDHAIDLSGDGMRLAEARCSHASAYRSCKNCLI